MEKYNRDIYCLKCNHVGSEYSDGRCSECGSTHWIYVDEMSDMLEYQHENR